MKPLGGTSFAGLLMQRGPMEPSDRSELLRQARRALGHFGWAFA